MAIAFGRGTTLTQNSSPIAPSIVIDAGETGVCAITIPTTCAVTSITGGGTWTQRASVSQSTNVKLELWSTDAGAALAATSISVAISGVVSDGGVQVCAYTGAVALGTTATNTGAGTANPSVVLVTQDANNFTVAGFGSLDTAAYTDHANGVMQLSDSNISFAEAFVDNTSASPGSVTTQVTHGLTNWAGAVLELRTVAPSVTVAGPFAIQQRAA